MAFGVSLPRLVPPIGILDGFISSLLQPLEACLSSQWLMAVTSDTSSISVLMTFSYKRKPQSPAPHFAYALQQCGEVSVLAMTGTRNVQSYDHDRLTEG
jgi:hypothetical protein